MGLYQMHFSLGNRNFVYYQTRSDTQKLFQGTKTRKSVFEKKNYSLEYECYQIHP